MTKVEVFKVTYAILKEVEAGTTTVDEAMNFILANYSTKATILGILQKGA